MTTLKNIDKAIARFATSAAAVNVMAHSVAMMIFRHAAPEAVGADCAGTGDCTRAVKLVRAMPASFRRTMMIEWFKKNTPIRVKLSDSGDKCEYDPAYKKLTAEEKVGAWNLENANIEPFYDIAEKTAEEKPEITFEALVKMVEGLAKRITTAVTENKVAAHDVLSAQAIVGKLEGLRITRVKPEPANEEAPAAATLVA